MEIERLTCPRNFKWALWAARTWKVSSETRLHCSHIQTSLTRSYAVTLFHARFIHVWAQVCSVGGYTLYRIINGSFTLAATSLDILQHLHCAIVLNLVQGLCTNSIDVMKERSAPYPSLLAALFNAPNTNSTKTFVWRSGNNTKNLFSSSFSAKVPNQRSVWELKKAQNMSYS